MRRLLPLLLTLTLGCSSLGAAVAGVQTAENIAKTACKLLESTNGDQDAVLAVLADLQKQIVQARARRAVERGANAATLAAMEESLSAMQASMAKMSGQISRLAGEDATVKVQPCPIAAPSAAVDGGAP